MELKHLNDNQNKFCYILLIVPYGIETKLNYRQVRWDDRLLIVPYGIET